MSRFRRGSVISVLVALTLVWSVAAASAATRTSVIVLFDDAVANPAALTQQLGRTYGFTPRHVMGSVLKGFVASVPTRAVPALAGHPRVVHLEVEVAERIVDQTLPTGVDRIEVDKNPTVQINGPGQVNIAVAVIDTGIAEHTDLNVLGRVSFSGGDGFDTNGHGTHVAGTIGAVGNLIGVVGVAPGTPVYGVQVCKPGGICMSGDIVNGINHVAQKKRDFKDGKAGGVNFAAANFSISSADTTTKCNSSDQGVNATHTAICKLVAEGVVFAMAGGNDARKKDAYPEAFAVAAIADFDGQGGQAGSPTCRSDEDDTLANFSNWNVDIAAPGVCILSTWADGGYNTISGTSMATPHVAGAVALYLHANSAAPATSKSGVQAIEKAIVDAALAEGISGTNPCSYNNERGTHEPLLFVNGTAFGGDNSCTVAGSDGGGDPPPDTTSPVISEVAAVNVTASSADVTWTTDEASTSVVRYGTSTALGSSAASDTLVTNHSISLAGLAASTTYYFEVESTDASGNKSVDNNGGAYYQFTTTAASSATTMHVASLTATSALKGKSGRWEAIVTVTIHDSDGNPVGSAAVTGTWSGDRNGTVSGTTGSNGQVSFSTGSILGSSNYVIFKIDSVVKDGLTYDSSLDNDAFLDTLETDIKVDKPLA